MPLSSNTQLGLIGAGAMSNAIVKGLINAKKLSASQITVTDISDQQLKSLSDIGVKTINTAKDKLGNAKLAQSNGVIILAVKPHIIEPVLKDIRDSITENGPLIISIAVIQLKRL
jgi:pyrroline-5-carboxylate reductase